LFCLTFQSQLARSFAAWPAWRALKYWPANRHRSWDSALRSFAPAGQFHPRFRGGGPPVVGAVPIIPIIFRRGIGRQTEPDSLEPRLCAADIDCDDARLLGVDPSEPAISSRRSMRRRSVLPWALPLSGLPDTPAVRSRRARPRRSPSAVARPSLEAALRS
jgi:hypothetical protein